MRIKNFINKRLIQAAILFAIFSGLNRAHSQDGGISQTPSGQLVMKKAVRRVIVDVVVTGSDGNPVHGLTKDNFRVSEDGKPQQVLSFEKHDFSSVFIPPKLPHLPPNTFLDMPASPERGPLYVLLLDLVNTELDDQATARQQLLKFIDEKPDGVRLAIFVLTGQLRLVQGFTDDKSELYGAMDPKSPRPHVPRIFLMGRNAGRGDPGTMVGVFNTIATFLDGLPGRKNLIWFSGGFPMTLFPSDDDGQSYKEEIKDTLDTMARGQVAVYPVDVRGVVVTNSYAPAGATPGGGVYNDARSGRAMGSAAADSTGSAPSPANTSGTTASFASPMAGYSLLNSSYSTQDEIAKVTGGHAFHSNNGLAEALSEAVNMGASYYSLSYSPTNENYDGKLRTIHVEITHPGFDLSYRRSYYGEDPGSPKARSNFKVFANDGPVASKPGESLYANMQYGAPMAHDVFFSAHIHPSGAPSMATQAQMEYFSDQPSFLAKNPKKKPAPPFRVQSYVAEFFVPTRQFNQHQSSSTTGALEFTTVAFDSDGRIVSSIVQQNTEDVSTDPSSSRPVDYHVMQSVDVPLTATSIRVGVRDPATDHMGTLEVPLPLAPEPPVQAVNPQGADRQSGAGAKTN